MYVVYSYKYTYDTYTYIYIHHISSFQASTLSGSHALLAQTQKPYFQTTLGKALFCLCLSMFFFQYAKDYVE